MNIEEIREALRGAKRDGIMIDMPYTVIRFLLSEVDRLTAELKEKHLEAQGYLCERDYHESEIERLNDLLAEKEGECERWHKAFTHYHVNNGVLEESHRAVNAQLKIEGKRAQDMANLAASRLADQEAIERHTRRVVAKECAEIAETMWSDHYWAWPAMQTYADKIRKKYGVAE